MKSSCNIVSAFCTDSVKKKIKVLYSNLAKRNLLPLGINLEDDFDIKNNNLFFITLGKNKNHLKDIMKKIYRKKGKYIIISDTEDNFFDFAMEYNICNIIHKKSLNEFLFLGILRRFFKREFGLAPFFKKGIFEKRYSLCGNVRMHSLIENLFADFIDTIHNMARSAFIINSHELVTNALAYGVLGISTQARDRKAYDIGNHVEIPKDKEIKVHLFVDKDLYGISVKDFGGTLTIQRILERIRRQSIVAGETIPQGIEDYTGRGLAILSHHGLLIFSIKPGKYTDVSLIYNVKTCFEKKPISILATEL